MSAADLVILESDHRRFTAVLDRVRQDANARLAFLLDRNGQQLARSGNLDGMDPTSLASLAAGSVAATDGLAKLVGENEFSVLFHEGRRDNLHINMVGGTAILVILFDERSSLGLVRLRVQQVGPELTSLVDGVVERSANSSVLATEDLAEITDEDIDALFG